MPRVRLGETSDPAQAIVEQDALDAGVLETHVAEVDIVCVIPLVESVPGALAALEAKELGELRGRSIACQGVATVASESVAAGF